MTSVVIAAHNEAAVIGRCLDALLDNASAGEFDITVVANGCTDDTARIAAARPGVRVLELAEAGKPAALNAGDAVAQGFPRVYLDADIVLPAAGLRALSAALTPGGGALTTGSGAMASGSGALGPGSGALASGGAAMAPGGGALGPGSGALAPGGAAMAPGGGALGPDGGALASGGGALAAVPRRELDLAGRPVFVRAYYAINSRLPVFRDGLFGRGVIALSAAGRSRFTEFPDRTADDLFLDSLYTVDEKREVPSVSARIATPLRTRDLVRRLVRVRRGNAALRADAALRPNAALRADGGLRPGGGRQAGGGRRADGGAFSADSALPADGGLPGGDGLGAGGVRRAARLSWLRDVVLPRPWLAPAAACYVGITITAAVAARRSKDDPHWGRDDSSR